MKNNPKVTVLMSVYNGEKYLREAIESILQQSFTDFEFLIIDDGCTDSSVEIIKSYNDPRICLVQNGSNAGLIASLNRGLDLARGEYIARMDADDISLPQRLARQVNIMDHNPEIGICGTGFKTFGDHEHLITEPLDSPKVKCLMLFDIPLTHATVIMRRKFLCKYDLHYKNFQHAEDYDFFARCSNYFPIINIGDVHYLVRQHSSSVTKRFRNESNSSKELIQRSLIENLGLRVTEEEYKVHSLLGAEEFKASRDFIKQTEVWLLKLKKYNSLYSIYPEPLFSEVISEKWFRLCTLSSKLGLWTWKTYNVSPLRKDAKIRWSYKIRFGVKCTIRYGIK